MDLSQPDTSQPDTRAHFDRLLRNIQAGDSSSASELISLLQPGVRFFIARSFDAFRVDEIAGEVMARVLKAIRERELQDAECVLGYVRSVVQLRICGAGFEHRKPPQRDLEDSRLSAALNHLSRREREILKRFYLRGQPEKQILAEMKLSPREFRELKHSLRAELARPPKPPKHF